MALSHKDTERVRTEQNTARYFTEKRQVAWVLLVGTCLWGVFSYERMPKAKDPLIPTRVAVATCQWPGTSAEKIEQLVTRRIEEKMSENSHIEKVESISRSSVAVVYVTLEEGIANNRDKEFDDIKLKLDSITDLPGGAGPINFIKDFGDTAALLLTVASPPIGEVELSLRAKALEAAITKSRSTALDPNLRVTFVVNFPPAINMATLRRTMASGSRYLVDSAVATEAHLLEGPGYIAMDMRTEQGDDVLLPNLLRFARTHMRLSELHPDVWRPMLVRDPNQTLARMQEAAGDRYSYRELDEFTDSIARTLQTVPMVSKVARSGVLPETVYMEYSQERLASYGLQASNIRQLLAGRNITVPGGVIEVSGKNITIDPSGELKGEREIGGIMVGTTSEGTPFYLRDLVDINRGYQSPPRFLNYASIRQPNGSFRRSRAVTLSVQMRPGMQIGEFANAVDDKLAVVRSGLPEDLIMRRTSDQPLQVRENVELFMNSLYEAIVLVVIVALIGFWEWRSGALLALSIPITLAMTFGFMHLLGLDVQQISIASLILALGLLVDDPVVAGDAIKRSLDDGAPNVVAAWLGPTKLARAIMFATVTNIGAYLPLLALEGDVGRFIYSLPVVLTCSLVASRLVSMTFIPLLGYTLLRPHKQLPEPMHIRKQKGFARIYAQTVGLCIDHRRVALAVALVILVLAGMSARSLKVAFFPQDMSYLSYIDIWLPEDAPLSATRDAARIAERAVIEAADAYGKEHERDHVVEAVTSFIGGGAPRFWFSVNPEIQQLNYAQLVLQVNDKHMTPHLIGPVQAAVSRQVPGARCDVRQLENGKPVGIPAAVRISGENIAELRRLAEQVKAIFMAVPEADRIRDDWGAETLSVKLKVDPDRANLAGVTNYDVAVSSATAMNGQVVSILRDGHRQIPVVSRLRSEERAQLADIENLYVNSSQTTQKVPLKQVSDISYSLETEKIRRRNQFRTITVAGYPVAGVLPSEIMKKVTPQVEALAKTAPKGYEVVIGGEQEERKKGFKQLSIVLFLSIAAIFFALVVQFQSGVKPLMVFAAIPFGVVGALVSLAVMHAPFGFMAFLGIVSLIGVIVSHVIVLFDFIEERHEEGEDLKEALQDAGIIRLRPVLITVGATVLGLIPLALHGGPLWEPLCYAQIGGLTVATVVTLLLVPILYAVFVYDLKWITWDRPQHGSADSQESAAGTHGHS